MTAPAARPPADPVLRLSAAVLATLAVLVALKLAGDIVAPLATALVGGVMLGPLVDRLERLSVPPTLAATLVMVAGALFLASLAFLIEPYFWQLIDQIPRIKWELLKLLREYRDLIQSFGNVNDEVARALGDASPQREDASAEIPTLMDALFLAPAILAQIAIFLGGLFFFLLTRRSIYRWLAARIGAARGGGDAVATARRVSETEALISRYFLTITIINTGLGLAVAGALTLIGLPGAVAWGAAAMMLNFVLYLGPATMVGALLLAGLMAFDGALSLAPPAAYLALNLIEAQFTTPALVGRRIAINPLMIFVALVFWLWLWGPIGGVIAIPILVIVMKTFEIFTDRPAGEDAET